MPHALSLAIALLAGQSTPPTLAELIEQLDRGQPAGSPVTRARVEKLLGSALDCTTPPSCEARDVAIADARIGDVDLRAGVSSKLLVLGEISGTCLSLESLRARYPGGHVANACAHAHCWYYELERPWGRLSIGLPQSGGEPQCANAIVMNID